MPRKHQDRQAAFWANVDRSCGEDACWPWLLYVEGNGYGRLSWWEDGCKVSARAHRVAFAFANGHVPTGRRRGDLIVRHSCDNPRCCNPAHLLLGTHKDNFEDARSRGRNSPPPPVGGEQHPRFRLTPAVRAQVDALAGAGLTRAAIARETGLGWTTVHRALGGASR